MEPSAEQGITGTGKDLGDVWSWNGDTIVQGSLTHTELVPNEKVVNHMVFLAPMEDQANDVWTFEATENGTKITWSYSGESPFIMRPIMQSMMESAVGGDFEKGLATFKELAEAMPASNNLEIAEAELPQVHYLAIEATSSMDTLDAVMGRLYGELMAYAGKNNIQLTGAPLSITTAWSEEKSTFWAAIPVADGVEGNGENIVAGDLTPRKTVSALHVGSYQNLYGSHTAIYDYIQAKGLEMQYPVVEVYLNDPGQTAEEDLQTQIYYPVN